MSNIKFLFKMWSIVNLQIDSTRISYLFISYFVQKLVDVIHFLGYNNFETTPYFAMLMPSSKINGYFEWCSVDISENTFN